MTQSTRKLIGTIAMILLVGAYPLAIMEIYARLLTGTAWWVLIGFFAVAGMAWFYPASWIIRWMVRTDRG